MKYAKRMMILLVVSLSVFFANGCATSSPELENIPVQAHWMQQGDIAPFAGVLLSEDTYYKLREKIINLSHRE